MSGGSTVLVLQSVKNLLVPDLHSCFTLSDLVQVLHQMSTRWTRTPDGLHSHSGHVTIQTWYYCSTAGICPLMFSEITQNPQVPFVWFDAAERFSTTVRSNCSTPHGPRVKYTLHLRLSRQILCQKYFTLQYRVTAVQSSTSRC